MFFFFTLLSLNRSSSQTIDANHAKKEKFKTIQEKNGDPSLNSGKITHLEPTKARAREKTTKKQKKIQNARIAKFSKKKKKEQKKKSVYDPKDDSTNTNVLVRKTRQKKRASFR
jgi:hypothetical protein